MKKVLVIVFTALALTACAGSPQHMPTGSFPSDDIVTDPVYRFTP